MLTACHFSNSVLLIVRRIDLMDNIVYSVGDIIAVGNRKRRKLSILPTNEFNLQEDLW